MGTASEGEYLDFEAPRRLDTERTLFDAELAQTQTLQLYYSAIVRLYAALGGGWSVEP